MSKISSVVRPLPVERGSDSGEVQWRVAQRASQLAFDWRLALALAGFAAAGLLALNSFRVRMSQEARSYALLSTLTVLSYIMLDRAVESGRRRDRALLRNVRVLLYQRRVAGSSMFRWSNEPCRVA